jgi:hypothetical protein
MYLQIKKSELVPDKFGQHVKITMIGLYDDSGKWIKWVKLDKELLSKLMETKINY